jgi:hypothetical protein
MRLSTRLPTRCSRRRRAVLLPVAAALLATSVLGVPHVASALGRHGHPPAFTWVLFDAGGGAARPPSVPGSDGPTTVLYLVRSATAATTPAQGDAELFTSYAAFATAAASGGIPHGLRYVAYDPEKWTTTPTDEQLAPRRFMRQFTSAAHRRGLRSIVVPGLDLLLAPGAPCAKHRGTTLDQAFVRCDLATGGEHADDFVVQGAPVETTPARYESLVRNVARQVHRVSRATEVLATLATAHDSLGRLVSLAKRVRRYVQGFEVNTSPTQLPTAVRLMRQVGA